MANRCYGHNLMLYSRQNPREVWTPETKRPGEQTWDMQGALKPWTPGIGGLGSKGP